MAGFANIPPLLGTVERIDAEGAPTALAVLHGYVRNQGDGWTFATDYLARELERHEPAPEPSAAGAEEPGFGLYMPYAEALGRRTGELHATLARAVDDPAFAPEPIDDTDLATWRAGVLQEAEEAFAAVEQAHAGLDAAQRERADLLLARRLAVTELIESLTDGPVAAWKTRTHGDYHLGQTLVAQDDIYILDFEGEPAGSAEERRRKTAPLRDVAGMLRSFDYAAWAALFRTAERTTAAEGERLSLALRWRDAASARFLRAYAAAVAGTRAGPEVKTEADRLLRLFLLEKALYEIRYEAANPPNWLPIPLAGLLDLTDPEGGAGAMETLSW